MNNAIKAIKHIGIEHNVLFRVIDPKTGKILQEHEGHNCATNSMLTGIGHYLIGDGVLNQGSTVLDKYIPKYISLGTMGLMNQYQDDEGLPAGIGYGESADYIAAKQRTEEAKAALEEAEAALENLPCRGQCIVVTGELHRYRSSDESLVIYPASTDSTMPCGRTTCPYVETYQAYLDALAAYEEAHEEELEILSIDEETRFKYYMNTRPGYGADGYDENVNNNRKWMGLGYPYTSYYPDGRYSVGDYATYNGILYQLNTALPTPSASRKFDASYWTKVSSVHQPGDGKTINLELISPSHPRSSVSMRDLVPEIEAELPKTIDVVFSAMVSTGALAQYRESGLDYIFITEAGLWSKKQWSNGGENGLLAAYRIVPPNEDNWDMTEAENRLILKQSILKVPVNSVVQVIWKIQLGSIDMFERWYDHEQGGWPVWYVRG